MAGRSAVMASEEQKAALETLAASKDRGEADRARAILLSLKGWTSARIAEVFCVRQDTVRFWRGEFARGGVEAVKASVYAGPPPVKTEAALRVCAPLLEAPVADRRNWTIPRLIAEIKRVERIEIGPSQLSKALRKKTSGGGGPGTRRAGSTPPA
jgi:transposase